jgi:hypothetical protein
MRVTVEYNCGHTVVRWNPVGMSETTDYLERAKDRPCPACKKQQDRIASRRAERWTANRGQIRKLQIIANCLRVGRGDGLTPVEARYVRMLVGKMDREDADLCDH